ncbi:MAG TPA: 1,2-phenylacetyl-CoA epoxidase subunit PaaE [Natronosporangium sp.]|nr:1,2-phenylacetyl-CoA epoxidase subunit PaaE [Natronosporangium sp.]
MGTDAGTAPAVTITRPVRRRPIFHRLPVVALDRLTEDSLAITFGVPERLREAFAFQAGQHVTVRRVAGDAPEVRRSYSICSTPMELADRGRLRIGVKQLPGGEFSGYAATQLAVGDEVEVMPPLGRFTTALEAGRTRWYAGIVAGSGITPVLSLVATALEVEPDSRFTLLYGNRYTRSVMFAEELSDLKDRWPDRLQVVHVLSREPGDAKLLSGRIDAERLPRLLDAFLPGGADEWFLCGPYRMVLDARAVLAARGVPERSVHTELFHVTEEPPPPRRPDDTGTPAGTGTRLTVLLDGRASEVVMRPDERVLDAALRVRGELPYSCRGGVCATCRARVVDGEVTMARNWALEPEEVAAGYVLTCQSTPVTDHLTVDYDV